MGLEEYAETFKDMDKYGLLKGEDRNYLIEKGILKPLKKDTNICCPNCGSPIPIDLIRRISDLVIEAVYKDREKYAKQVSSINLGKTFDTESIMFR